MRQFYQPPPLPNFSIIAPIESMPELYEVAKGYRGQNAETCVPPLRSSIVHIPGARILGTGLTAIQSPAFLLPLPGPVTPQPEKLALGVVARPAPGL